VDELTREWARIFCVRFFSIAIIAFGGRIVLVHERGKSARKKNASPEARSRACLRAGTAAAAGTAVTAAPVKLFQFRHPHLPCFLGVLVLCVCYLGNHLLLDPEIERLIAARDGFYR
jgi:hypothetical protein